MIVEVTQEAEADLLRLVEFLMAFSEFQALDLIERYERVLLDLREFPELGRRNEHDPSIRMLVRGNCIYSYEVSADRAIILRILDGRAARPD